MRVLPPAVLALALVLLHARGAAAQRCAANVPHVHGTWSTLPYLMPINPISATLLHSGRVLIVAGSENDASNNSPGSESYRAAIWDPMGTTGSRIEVQNLEYDVFCSGTAALPDGRPLIVGGTSDYSFTGENRATIFDPMTLGFVQAEAMADGRWYATATALGDGRVMAWSGLGLWGGTNGSVEIYDLRSAGVGWTAAGTAPISPQLYPRMMLLRDGKVFWTGQGSGEGDANSWIFDPVGHGWTHPVATTGDRTYGSAVLLPLSPPSYTPRVMNFGGGSPARSSTEIIDFSISPLAWQPGPPMSTARIQMNAVLLPDGTVLAEGGSVNNQSPDAPGRQADLYDPSSNTFSPAGTASFSRLYHSTALLLPDATVASLGSNPDERGSYQPAIEIYRPTYLFDVNDQPANRPSITGVSPSETLRYGDTAQVSYTSASPIASAVLVRPGSSTHAFDMEQRLVILCSTSTVPCSGSGTPLSVTMPPDGNVAPPGWYMLFLVDAAGVPSIAAFVQLTPYTGSPLRGTIVAPAGDVEIALHSRVTFSASTTAARSSWIFPGGFPATATGPGPVDVTFDAPGEYMVSFTAIGSDDNSDPSPPTRKVKVLPSWADFDIDVSPSSQVVLPGESATFTVSIRGLSGFSGPVTLGVGSESGFPSGVTSGGFSPSMISGSVSSTLTMNTSASATPYALSLTVTGAGGGYTHTASTTLVVELPAPASLTATAGAGQASLDWPDVTGATGYDVKRSTTMGGPYVSVGCPTSSSFTNTGLVDGTTYYYVVSAVYSGGLELGGESVDSPEAAVTPNGILAPTGLQATASRQKGVIQLSWAQPNGLTVRRNRIYRRRSTGTYGSTPTVTLEPPATSDVDSSLSHTRYCYVVTAVTDAGETARSNEACATAK
jgi:hypothetical protein